MLVGRSSSSVLPLKVNPAHFRSFSQILAASFGVIQGSWFRPLYSKVSGRILPTKYPGLNLFASLSPFSFFSRSHFSLSSLSSISFCSIICFNLELDFFFWHSMCTNNVHTTTSINSNFLEIIFISQSSSSNVKIKQD